MSNDMASESNVDVAKKIILSFRDVTTQTLTKCNSGSSQAINSLLVAFCGSYHVQRASGILERLELPFI